MEVKAFIHLLEGSEPYSSNKRVRRLRVREATSLRRAFYDLKGTGKCGEKILHFSSRVSSIYLSISIDRDRRII